MYHAEKADKGAIVGILTQAFSDNKSVNYIVKQDRHRLKRIERLMAYSFEYCRLFGEVLISEDRQACALIMYPHKKKSTVKTTILDLGLAVRCVGIAHIGKVLKREAVIKQLHAGIDMCYLWFIGVTPAAQHKGLGSALLQQIVARADVKEKHIYLETSMERNIPWYEKFGFEVYKQLDLGYSLACLKRNAVPRI